MLDFEFSDSMNVDHAIADKVRDTLGLPLEKRDEALPADYLAIDLIVKDYTRGPGASLSGSELDLLVSSSRWV